MKKTIATVFSIIIVLVVMGIVTNIVTGGAFFNSVINAVATPINTAWSKVVGDDGAKLINTEDFKVEDENDLSVFDKTNG